MKVQVGDVTLIGTAHVSAASVQLVEDTIRETKPSKVLVELDPRRLEALQDPDAWQKTDIVKVLKEKKQHLFLVQLYLANMQARMGEETGVSPGSELLRAIQVADEVGAEVVLIDRDVGITLRRGFGAMGFWQRLRLLWNFWAEVFTPANDADRDVDAMLETDAITAMTEEFAQFAPTIKTALIDERDAFMASHIHATHGTAVAVVGAGHLPGIEKHLADPASIPSRDDLNQEPPKRFSVLKAIGFVVPLAIIAAFAYLFYTGDYAALKEVALAWVVINGGLSALGAALAGGHIYAVIVAFVAAPITSLNPALAAGWFAGLTQAKVRTPTVADFEKIRSLKTFRDYHANGVVRILFVTAFANLGSVVGTYVAGWQIVESLM